MMRGAIVAGLLAVALPAWGQAMMEPAPDSLVCQQEWRRFHSELGRLVIRLRCNDGKYVAALSQSRYRPELWDGVVTCAGVVCGQDKITLQEERDLRDGVAIGCQEFGKLIPREWLCKAAIR